MSYSAETLNKTDRTVFRMAYVLFHLRLANLTNTEIAYWSRRMLKYAQKIK